MDFEMKGCTWGNHPEYDKGFKAGQQSKQAEIDALKMSNHHLSVQVLDAEAYSDYWEKNFKRLQIDSDELKREPMDLRDVDIPHGTIVLEK